ncbi:MAG: T9SS type A sorting domain-containing protein [bacterium]|nr:T9SS type A sorting domain-containing protein [bacterium]
MKSLSTRSRHVVSYLTLTILFILITGFVRPVHAVWHTIMNEPFENISNTWTWVQPPAGQMNSHPWVVTPWSANPHWGIQHYIYRLDPAFPNTNVQSAWCDASNTPTIPSRDPEYDRYRTNMHTHMRWGPFATDSIRLVNNGPYIQVTNAVCSFEWLNRTAVGDTFFWEAAYSLTNTPPDPITERNRWFLAVKRTPIFDSAGHFLRDTLLRGFHCGRADTYWQLSNIYLDSLDSAGTVVSLLDKPFVWVGWRFKSNAIMDSLRGAFVDNVKLAIDDGMFDLEALTSFMVHSRSNVVVNTVQTDDTVRFILPYRIGGSGILRNGQGQPVQALVRCVYDQNSRFDTLVTIDAGESGRSDSISTPPLPIRTVGEHVVQWTMDFDNVVVESNELNNTSQYLFPSTARNIPPTITLHSFTETDTVTIHRQSGTPTWIPVVVETHDPDDEAMWYLFVSQDSTLGSGNVATLNRPWPISENNSTDTVMWNVGSLPAGYWYLQGMIQDAVNEIVFVRANACIEIASTATPESNTSQLPTTTFIRSTYPNPFNNEITFTIGVREGGSLQLQIHDVTGREVTELPIQAKTGWQTVRWQPQGIANGEYFARLTQNGRVMSVKKVLLLK